MGLKTVTIMGNTTSELDVVGEKFEVGGFYGYTDGIFTIAIYGQSLSGRVIVQGTLVVDPTENDWFALSLDGDKHKDYDDFSGVDAYTILANLVYVRAMLDRTSVGITSIAGNGIVEQILVSF